MAFLLCVPYRCRLSRREVSFICRVLLLPLLLLLLLLLCVLPYCCCCCSSSAAASCCCSSCARGPNFVAGSLNPMPVFSFSSFKRDLVLMVLLSSTGSHLRPRFVYILGNYGLARSQGGRHPAAANTPLVYMMIIMFSH